MSVTAPCLNVDPQHRTGSHAFKVSVAVGFIGGFCLALLGVLALSSSGPTATESTNLVGVPTSLRMTPMMTMRNLPGPSPWKELALASIEDSNRCDRDVSMNANVNNVMSRLSSADKAMVTQAGVKVRADAAQLLKAGQVAPLGFFDPMGFSATIDDGKLLFYREAEIKHGRVCMLAFLGMLVGEQYHPLFGGDIDVASTKVFQEVGLKDLWPIAFLQFIVAAAFEEIRTSKGNLLGRAMGGIVPNEEKVEGFAAKSDRVPGDLGFDPLGIKPKNDKDLMSIQNKEILNGRLAMIAVAGIAAQEQVTGEKVFR